MKVVWWLNPCQWCTQLAADHAAACAARDAAAAELERAGRDLASAAERCTALARKREAADAAAASSQAALREARAAASATVAAWETERAGLQVRFLV